MITRRQVMKTLALGSTVLAGGFAQGLGFAQTCPTQTADAALDTAFRKAYNLFNAHDPAIFDLLATDVSVFSVNYKKRYDGIPNVKQFFSNDWTADNPSFTPNPGYDASSVGNRGVIIGTACWKDNNGPETIGFVFQWVKQGTIWLIRRLYAD